MHPFGCCCCVHDSLTTGSLHYVIPMGIGAAGRYDSDKTDRLIVCLEFFRLVTMFTLAAQGLHTIWEQGILRLLGWQCLLVFYSGY